MFRTVFSRPVLQPLSSLYPLERYKSSASQPVCLLKYEGCLLFKRACGSADIVSHPHDKKLSITPAAECKMEACLPATLANQQRGLLQRRWAQKHHGRCSHNRQYQHAAASLRPCSCKMKECGEHRYPVLAHRYEQMNNLHEQLLCTSSTTLAADAQYKSGIVGHNRTECSAELQASGTQKYPEYIQNWQHLQQRFTDDLTYSILTNSRCQSSLKKLHHRIA